MVFCSKYRPCIHPGEGQAIELVSYTAGNGSAAPADVFIQDALVAQAGTATGTMTFDQWGTVFQNVWHQIPPTTSDACTSDASSITVQQYLALLDTIHTSNCNTVTFNNPSNIETIVPQMTAYAQQGDPNYPNLNWDQWNFWYNYASGQSGPGPDSRCQQQSGGVIPNRWIRMGIRDWVWFIEFIYGPGCARLTKPRNAGRFDHVAPA
jgi:hypothetical protein